ncbi:MAG: 6-phosphofructokinase [Brachymonas sp.]|jgi:6-phosphofructokinase 1
MMKKIAILTSGGDAPGMNAAIRAAVRACAARGVQAVGVHRGYNGLMENALQPLGARDVANILQRGGTMLLTARSKAFMQPEGRAQAAAHLRAAGVGGLIVIGGDGSFRGAHALATEHDIPVVGLPGTIDNDIWGTDHSIGYFTAIETAVEAVDKLRDTGASHERTFIIEVMGRHAGHIAMDVALAGGAEDVLLPENPRSCAEVVSMVDEAHKRGKSSAILIVAEGHPGGGAAVQAALEQATGQQTRLAVLGHIQRGGRPAVGDRILASRLGVAAVDALLAGQRGVMLGMQNQQIVQVPLHETWEKRKAVDMAAYACLRVLSV